MPISKTTVYDEDYMPSLVIGEAPFPGLGYKEIEDNHGGTTTRLTPNRRCFTPP